MNVGQIKAFMGDQKVDQKAGQKASVHPNEMLKKQLQQDGLSKRLSFLNNKWHQYLFQ